ncbi:NUDIX domain-containing protein [Paenibacillus chondroitinus]|uniref:NUDIX domain-containing protein n=1 Tax=Paenibacillus chondroitinus TaxID=59842 RepID=A0ABU6D8W4_9BACL|nr:MULTISPECIES: NUDIX domain-containing protein [Paenibacillus]MCY9656534.1 NUDIX domain-containing protein [Paenibacillus anseongense]MEB4794183.1 NUDIX domain-containing protein [Paenibacillus chondroitinus]
MTENLIERAAGGLVLRKTHSGIHVLLIHDRYGHIGFPKGHLEAGETWEEAAVREISEETGINSRILSLLGDIEYPIERKGLTIRKQVRLFLLEAIDEQAEPIHQADEVQGAQYFIWEDAVRLHLERGYADLNWVFDKAKELMDLHEKH